MNNDAIKLLMSRGAVVEGEIGNTAVPTCLIPDNMSVQSLEAFLDAPIARREAFYTSAIADFAAYLGHFAKPESSIVAIEPTAAAAHAIIDYGTPLEPEWCYHWAHLSLKATPEYKAVKEIAGGVKSQRGLIEWLEDWRHMLTPVDANDEDVPAGLALSALRSIKVEKEGSTTSEVANFESSASAFSKIAAKGKDANMPVGFRATFRPYEEIDPVNVELRLSVQADDGVARFKVRWVATEKTITDIRKMVEAKIKDSIPQGIEVLFGTIETVY